MELVSTKFTNLVPLEQFHHKPMVMYDVMELLQWHKVCELGGDKLHRPPVVALNEIWQLIRFTELCDQVYKTLSVKSMDDFFPRMV